MMEVQLIQKLKEGKLVPEKLVRVLAVQYQALRLMEYAQEARNAAIKATEDLAAAVEEKKDGAG